MTNSDLSLTNILSKNSTLVNSKTQNKSLTTSPGKRNLLSLARLPVSSVETHPASGSPLKHQEKRAQLKSSLGGLSEQLRTKISDTFEQVKQKASLNILPYVNLALIILFFLGLGSLGYSQLITNAPYNLAYSTQPTPPGRTLSFQGRLTDQGQNPITTNTAMTFRLYNVLTGGTALWTSSGCTVEPDQDGIFAVGLGDLVECGPAIGSDIFSENPNIWLEVQVDSETLSPRQPIRTVAYALNAETLQGYPLAPTGGAEANTVVTMNNDSVVLFSEAVVLQTAAGTNADIKLAADGTGLVNLDNLLYVSSSAGGVGIGTTNPGSAMLAVMTGNVGIGTTSPSALLHVAGTLSLNSGAVVDNIRTAIRAVGVADDESLVTEAAIASAISTSQSKWNVTSGYLTPNSSFADNVAVPSGKFAVGYGNVGTSGVAAFSGNVGIGTTNPTAELHTSGNIRTGNMVLAGKPQAFNNTFSYGGYTPDAFMYLDSTYNAFRIGINPASSYSYLSFMLGGQDIIGLTTSRMSPSLTYDNTISLGLVTQRWKSLRVGTDDSSFAGNVGIGTTTPSAKLNVIGESVFNGIVRPSATDTHQLGTNANQWQYIYGNRIVGSYYVNSDHFARYSTSNTDFFGSTTGNPELRIYGNDGNYKYGFLQVDSSGTFNIIAQTGENLNLGANNSVNLTVSSSGNVGIGTTTPSRLFHVNGGTGIVAQFSGRVVGADAVNSDEFVTLSQLTGGTGQYWQRNSTLLSPSIISDAISVGSTTPANAMFYVPGTTNNNAWFNLGTGNVGIGTTTPNDKLEVGGAIRFGTGTFTAGVGKLYTTAILGTVLTSNTGSTNDFTLADASGQQLISIPTGTHNLILQPTNQGNVGINTTNPLAKLSVRQAMSGYDTSFTSPHLSLIPSDVVDNTGFVGITYGSSTTANYGWSTGALRSTSGQSSFIWKHHSGTESGQEMMRITNTGNVGIGTTAPGDKLSVGPYETPTIASNQDKTIAVYGDGAAYFRGRDITNDIEFIMGTSNQGLAFAGAMTAHDFQLRTNNTARMTIKAGTGNVGIGTTTPAQRLDVSGNAQFSGALMPAGNAGITTYVLSSTGSGSAPTWVDPNTLGTNYWQRNSNILSPVTITDAISVGSTTSTSAMFYVPGTTNNDAWFNLGTGRLGIGVTNPSYSLHVLDSTYSSKYYTPGVTADAATWSGYRVGASYAGHLQSGINSSANMVLTHNAYVNRVGSAPDYKWTTSHASFGSRAIEMGYQTGISFYADSVASTANASFTPTERMRVTNAGNVGIGITNPSSKLHLYSNTAGVNEVIRVESHNFAGLELIGDRTNATGEPGGAYVLLSQDNSLVQGIFGIVNIAGFDGSGAAYTNTLNHSLLLGHRYDAPLQLGTNSTVKMTILGNGNVGIGTTTPSSTLHVNGDFRLASGTNVNNIVTTLGNPGSDNNLVTEAAIRTALNAGAGGMWEVSGGYLIPISSFSDNVAIPNGKLAVGYTSVGASGIAAFSGNVGIGTTAPSTSLHVVSASNNHIRSQRTANTYVDLYAGAAAYGSGLMTTNNLLFSTNADATNPEMVVLTSGNVGIGTTNPLSKLDIDVSSAAGDQGPVELRLGQSEVSNRSFVIRKNTSTPYGTDIISSAHPSAGAGDLRFFIGDYAAGEKMVIKASGNVGIGTTNPNTKLHISDSLVDPLRIQRTVGGSAASMVFVNGDDYWTRIGLYGDEVFSIVAANSGAAGSNRAFNVAQNGNVGIGIISPIKTLDVAGTSRFSSSIQLGNASTPKQYTNLATYNSDNAAAAGAFVIKTNVPMASNTMTRTVIEGYFYNSTSPFKIEVGGYFYSNGTFNNRGYVNTGSNKLAVRFARETATGMVVIILGDEGATYPYPKLAVTHFLAGHSTLNDNYGENWSIIQETSLAAYDNVISVPDTTAIPASQVTPGTFQNGAYTFQNTVNFPGSGIWNSAGNVGIGINTPRTRLNLEGGGLGIGSGSAISLTDGARRSIQIASDTNYGGTYDNHTGYLVYSTMPGNWGSGQLHFARATNWGTYDSSPTLSLSGTNVGIGTTTPSRLFHVNGGTGIVAQFSGRVIGGDAVNANEFVTLGQLSGGTGQYWQRNSTLLSPSTITDAMSVGSTTPASAMFYVPGTTNNNAWFNLGTGNLGIGTTSPANKLEVVGGIRTRDVSVSSLNPGITTTAGKVEGGLNQHLVFDLLNNDAADSIAFRYSAANNTAVDTIGFVMKGNGNVGIGTTSPTELFQVVGGRTLSYNGSGTLSFRPGTGGWANSLAFLGSSGTNRGGFGGYGSDDNLTYLYAGDTYSSPTMVWRSGNVGIGTTNPSTAKLEVVGSIEATENIFIGNGNNSRGLFIADVGTYNYGVNRSSDGLSLRSNSNNNNQFILSTTGNVGIGITNPTQNLHVVGGLRLTGGFYDASNSVGASGQILSSTGTGTAWVDPAGLGIRWNSITDPNGAQSLSMGAHNTSWSWTTGLFSSNWTGNTGTNNLFSLTTNASLTGTGSLLNVQTGTSSTLSPLRVRAGSTEALFVSSGGNVGVGTTSPHSDAKLQVVGGALMIGSNPQLVIDEQADRFRLIQTGTDYNTRALALGRITGTSDPVMWLANSGNVGIGVTDPDSLLNVGQSYSGSGYVHLAPDVSSTTYSATDVFARAPWDTVSVGYRAETNYKLAGIKFLTVTGTSTRGARIIHSSEDATGLTAGLHFQVGSGTLTQTMTMKNDGNVGIGTTNPTAKLDINTGTAVTLKLANPASGNSTMEIGRASGQPSIKSTEAYLIMDSLSNFASINHYVNQHVILAFGGGNVGIGNNSPTQRLDVSGNVRFSGALMPNNAAGTSGQFLVSAGAGNPPTWTSTVPATSLKWNALTNPDGNLSLNHSTHTTTFSSSATTGTFFTMAANSLTTGTGLAVTSSSASINSTNGLLYVANTGASTNGIVARIQSNSAAGSGLTVRANGNVGVGTTSATGKLEISGGSADTTTPQLILSGGKTGTVGDLYILDSQNNNLGVGYAAKVFGVNIQNQVNANNQVLQRTTSGGITGSAAFYLGADDVNQGGFGILTTPQNSSAGTVLTERLTVRGNGNVGIGTTTPTAKLDVIGSIIAGNFIANRDAGDGNSIVWNGTSYLTTPVYSVASPIGFSMSGGTHEKFLISRHQDSNNIRHTLIGQNMYYDTVNTNQIRTASGWMGGSAINISANYLNHGGTIDFIRGEYKSGTHGSVNTTTTVMRIDTNSGSVGIGTTNPLSTLHVNGDLRLASGTNVNNIVTTLGSPGSDNNLVTEAAIRTALNAGAGSMWEVSGGYLIPKSIFSDNVAIPSGKLAVGYTSVGASGIAAFNGNVGIRTTNASWPLEVNGTLMSEDLGVVYQNDNCRTDQVANDIRVTFPGHGPTTTGSFGSYIISWNNRAGSASYLLQASKPYTASAGQSAGWMQITMHKLGGNLDAGFEWVTRTTEQTVILLKLNISSGTHQSSTATFTSTLVEDGANRGRSTVFACEARDPSWTAPPLPNLYLGSGSVGIGTTNPSAALQVAGSARINDYLGVGVDPDSTYRIYANGAAYGIRAHGSTMGGRFEDSDSTSVVYAAYGTYGIYQGTGVRNFFTGNIGIGSVTPEAKLNVIGTTGGDNTWKEGIVIENTNATAGEPALSFKNNSTGSNYWITGLNQSAHYDIAYGTTYTNANTLLRIQSNDGNIGIGTVSPTKKLHVNGDIRADVYFDTTGSDEYYLDLNNSGRAFSLLGSASIGGYSINTSTTKLSVMGGNVGIRTTSADAALHVHDAGAAAGFRLVQVGDDSFFTDIDVANHLGLRGVQNSAVATLELGSNSGSRISGANGNIGIGVIDPLSKLEIYDTPNQGDTTSGGGNLRIATQANRSIGVGGTIMFENSSSTTSSAPSWTMAKIMGVADNSSTGNAAGRLMFGVRGNYNGSAWPWVDAMTIVASGNVGIGTTNPTQQLYVQSSTGADGIYIHNTSASSYGTFNFVNSSGTSNSRIHAFNPSWTSAAESWKANGLAIANNSQGITLAADGASGTLRFFTGGTAVANQRLTILSNGNVGIGKTNPTAELEVNGWIGRTSHQAGGLLGGYNNIGANSAKTSPIFTIGSNYKPNEETLGNMYGIGYSHTNASFIAASDNSWGQYIAADGDARIWLGASDGGVSYFNAGNVGIGTTNPGNKLDVNGGVRVQSITDCVNIGTDGDGDLECRYIGLPAIIASRTSYTSNETCNPLYVNNYCRGSPFEIADRNTNSGWYPADFNVYAQLDFGQRFNATSTVPASIQINLNWDTAYGTCGLDVSTSLDGTTWTTILNNYALSTAYNATWFTTTTTTSFRYLRVGAGSTVGGDSCGWLGIREIGVGGNSYADLAERYLTTETLTAGNIVSIKRQGGDKYEVTKEHMDPSQILGIITTSPHTLMGYSTQELGKEPADVALAGRVPAIVTTLDGQLLNGDRITSSTIAGLGAKATKAGETVGKALESTSHWDKNNCPIVSSIDDINWPQDDGTNQAKPCYRVPVSSLDDLDQTKLTQEYGLAASDYFYVGKVMTFVNVSWFDPDVYLESVGDINQLGSTPTSSNLLEAAILETLDYSVRDASTNTTITRLGNFAEVAIGKINAGLTKTSSLIAENAVVARAKIADLSTNTLQTTKATIDELTTRSIKLGNFELREIDGKLQIINQNKETVATIDQDGNAQLEGNIAAQSVQFEQNSLDNSSALGELVAQDIQTTDLAATGSTQLAELMTNSVETDSLTVTGTSQLGKLIATNIETETVETDSLIATNLEVTNQLTAQNSRFEQLEAKIAELDEIKATTASIIKGEFETATVNNLAGNNLNFDQATIKDVTVSGSLYADVIVGFEEKVAQAFRQPSLLGSLLGSGDEYELQQQELVEIIESAGYSATNSNQLRQSLADLNLGADDVVIAPAAAFVNRYLEVNGSAYIADSLAVNNYLIMGDGLKIAAASTIASIDYVSSNDPASSILYLQSSGVGRVDLMAGLMTIDSSGSVIINGDMWIAGNVGIDGALSTNTLLTNLIESNNYDQPTQIRLGAYVDENGNTIYGEVAGDSTENAQLKQSRLEIIDERGAAVATISATGRAEFADGLGIGTEDLSGETGQEETSVTHKTSGRAKIESGQQQIIIRSSKVSTNSQIFVTPLGSTNNQVIYVKSQVADDPGTSDIEGLFIVGFDTPASNDVLFNWWIVN